MSERHFDPKKNRRAFYQITIMSAFLLVFGLYASPFSAGSFLAGMMFYGICLIVTQFFRDGRI